MTDKEKSEWGNIIKKMATTSCKSYTDIKTDIEAFLSANAGHLVELDEPITKHQRMRQLLTIHNQRA